ncbi:phosphatase PAP2 family protein [Halomonas sp. 18H]|uniref:phosphatase PAP2 family protein n=1 Tax=Halomonas almeriensis TaxID=308163 RepID=UPI00223015FC|nr:MULTISPECIES: phosphatase PAP2 family protein [Halomonas]MCW4151814.1 phosphatase PAP2 family protein [Halomonas sp. 18H]MDN3554060.1 phosphatase PAP2 family protein [Halomonas almeriensis]
MKTLSSAVFERLDLLEWQLCQWMAGFSIHRRWLASLRWASRAGDWPIWVALIAAQPLLHEGPQAARIMGQYILTALVAIGIYRLVKTRLCRERPFITFHTIACNEPARDRYSFPSGHTMHAVMFMTLCMVDTPWLTPWLLPIVILIAISRVGLGLHYISDVIAGGILGYCMALFSLGLSGGA